MRLWFSADLHLGHDNIRKYCNRPFASLDEMNTNLIKNWNSRVDKEDTVIHDGDFCFRNTPNVIDRGEGGINKADYYEKQLNGKIIFIKGNHDKNNSCKTCVDNMTITFGGHRILIVHNPLHIINTNYDLAFVGHVHNLWKFKRIYIKNKHVDAINIGVDVNRFYPVSIEEILRDYSIWRKSAKK